MVTVYFIHLRAHSRHQIADSVRQDIVRLMREDPDYNLGEGSTLTEAILVETGKTWKQYVETMSISGVWGGPLELTVAASLFGRRIEVYKLDGDAFERTSTHGNNEAIDPPILLLFSNSHYDRLVERDSDEWSRKQALEALSIRKVRLY
jgi:hypothetical protein